MNSNNEKRSIFLPYLEKKTNEEMKRIPRHMHKILTRAVEKTGIPDQQKKDISEAMYSKIVQTLPGMNTGKQQDDIDTKRQGIQSEIYLSPGQVAFNHGFKFRYTYNEDDKKHKVKTRFGKTQNPNISASISKELNGNSIHQSNITLNGRLEKGTGTALDAGVVSESKIHNYNVRASSGVQLNNNKRVAPYSSLEIHGKHNNWRVKGGFIIQHHANRAYIEGSMPF